MRADGFDRALEACYDTLVAPEMWPAAFDGIARAAGAVACMFRRRTDEGAVLDLPMPDIVEKRNDTDAGRQHSDHFHERSRTLRRLDHADHPTPGIR